MRRSILIRLTFATLCACAAGGPALAAEHEVTARNFEFVPAELTIQAGDTVIWSNVQGVHNVDADDGSFRSGDPASAPWTFTHLFANPGTFLYHCDVHGAPNGVGMSGVITVEGGGGNPGSLRFSQEIYSVGEGAGSATLTVQRVGGDDGAASVDFATADGSAAAGADYGTTSGTLDWSAGDDSAKTFTVPILEDSSVEGTETVNLSLSNATGAGLGSPSQATLRINDNDSMPGDPGSIQLAQPSYQVSEGESSVSLTATRTGGADGAVSVDYSSTPGSASPDLDYTPVSGTLEWPDGDAAPRSFTIPILEDTEMEGDESFDLSLSNPGGGATLGSPATAAVTIRDNDQEPSFPCVEDDVTLCLLDDRFQVRVSWRRPNDRTGEGRGIPFTNQAGLFYFFDPSNLEMLVKMVNACGLNGHFWVFYAATTNVEFTVTVTDTMEGTLTRYRNPLGMAAAPVQDTRAFATCP